MRTGVRELEIKILNSFCDVKELQIDAQRRRFQSVDRSFDRFKFFEFYLALGRKDICILFEEVTSFHSCKCE